MEQYVRATVNAPVLCFTVCVTVLTTVLFGLVPALRTSQPEPDYLRNGARATGAGFQKLSFRNLLVTSQIALTVLLLVGACLVSRSLFRLWNTNMGFRTDHLLTARLKLPTN